MDYTFEIQPQTYLWSTLNKRKHRVFNDDFNQNGTRIYLTKQDTARAITNLEIVLR